MIDFSWIYRICFMVTLHPSLSEGFFQVAPHLSSQGLGGPCSRPTATQKIWYRREANPGPLGIQPETLTTRPQRRSIFPILFVLDKLMKVTHLIGY
jgi:hypothetical protein